MAPALHKPKREYGTLETLTKKPCQGYMNHAKMHLSATLRTMALQTKLALKQHFTDAPNINELMCGLLGDTTGCTLLEPSVGHGAFLRGLRGQPSLIDAVDVDEGALDVVRSQFSDLKLNIYQDDFVDVFVGGLLNASHPIRNTRYDLVISNPPYGLYFDPEYRKQIKRAFPEVYARESYGLFFMFALNQLKQDGRYVFLLPDTFLTSVNHKPLRSFICSQAAPTDIVRFPSKHFQTVNFGYGNLCVIAGHRRPLRPSDSVRWLDVFDNAKSLCFESLQLAPERLGKTLLQDAGAGWSSAIFGIEECDPKQRVLGDVAECRTGIYTGNNERFIGYDTTRVLKRLNGHAIDWARVVVRKPLDEGQRTQGLSGEQTYVPLVRGGHRGAFAETAWAIDWRKQAIEFYRTDKKARFQNSQFYFKPGLAVPMVTTKRISASLMDNAVFDQGVVGVFPRDARFVPALLLYLNSGLASQRMKKLVNGSANNSANYLKRLPVLEFTAADLELAARLVGSARYTGGLLQSICDDFVSQCGGLTNLDTQGDQLSLGNRIDHPRDPLSS